MGPSTLIFGPVISQPVINTIVAKIINILKVFILSPLV